MIFSSSAYGFCILLAVIIELPSRSQTTFALAPTLKGRRIDIEGARRHRRDVPAIFEVNFDEGSSFQNASLQVLPI